MNGSQWIHDPWSNKRHHPDCAIWENKPPAQLCTCAELDDQMVEEFQRVKPYTRSQTVPVSDPNAPHQSLASLIRAARRAGHLRPLQPYGGGHAPAFQP